MFQSFVHYSVQTFSTFSTLLFGINVWFRGVYLPSWLGSFIQSNENISKAFLNHKNGINNNIIQYNLISSLIFPLKNIWLSDSPALRTYVFLNQPVPIEYHNILHSITSQAMMVLIRAEMIHQLVVNNKTDHQIFWLSCLIISLIPASSKWIFSCFLTHLWQ